MAACTGQAPMHVAGDLLSIVVIVAVAMVVIVAVAMVRLRRPRQRLAAGPFGVIARRTCAPLADAPFAPVTHALREYRLEACPLRRGERYRRIVEGIERLQLAFEDVLGERAAGHL